MRNDLAPFAVLVLLAGCSGGDKRGGSGTPASDTAATAAPAGPESGGLVAYVTNEGSEELTIIDTRTDSAIATIPVGTRPRGVRVSRDGKTVFVALSGSPRCPPTMPDAECEKLKSDKSKDGIAVVDAASRTVTRVLPGGSDPETFDISQDGATLFVSNEDAGHGVHRGHRQREDPVDGEGGPGARGGAGAPRRELGLGHRRDRPQRDDRGHAERQAPGRVSRSGGGRGPSPSRRTASGLTSRPRWTAPSGWST